MIILYITRMSRYSWFKIKKGREVIYFDPGYAGYFRNQNIPRKALESGDLIMITHFHKDHLQPEALSKILGDKTTILAPSNCSHRIEHDFKLVQPGDKISFHDMKIHITPAYNTPEGNSTRKLHPKGSGVGYNVYLEDYNLYHAGDTDLIPEMNYLNKVDLAFLPIGGIFTMDLEEAIQAVKTMKPRMVIPMHQRTSDPLVFKKKVEAVTPSKVMVPELFKEFAVKN